MKLGLLLPTFGAQCSLERVLGVISVADEYGFHGVWVRDHLFVPRGTLHGGIEESGFHLEPLLSLASAAALSRNLRIGTAVLIPLRHPLRLAQSVATLDFLSERRFILGIGVGAFQREFAALGLDFAARRGMVRESVAVLRSVAGGGTSWAGPHFPYEDVRLVPAPRPDLSIWYGGSGTMSSIRFAFELDADGWMGTPDAAHLDGVLQRIREMEEARQRHMDVTLLPKVVVGADVDDALTLFNHDQVLGSADRRGSDRHTSLEELGPGLVYGSAEQVAERLLSLAAKGVDGVVLDLRLAGERFDEVLRRVGEDVVPHLVGPR